MITTTDIVCAVILSVIILSIAIMIGVWYYFNIYKPVNDEQKAASKETESPIDFNEADEYFMPIEKEQLN